MKDLIWFVKTSWSYMAGYNRFWIIASMPYAFYKYKKSIKEGGSWKFAGERR